MDLAAARHLGDLAVRADLARGTHDQDGADAALLGSAYMIVNMLPSIAALAATIDMDAAAKLFGAADEASLRFGLVPDPGGDQTDARARSRKALGPERFEQLAAEGALLAEPAVAQLARDLGRRVSSAALG